GVRAAGVPETALLFRFPVIPDAVNRTASEWDLGGQGEIPSEAGIWGAPENHATLELRRTRALECGLDG
ncbi:hypothetical protein, partial [Kamptonema formosum]|uniref:hypothetical protein n=1 Tax=Kamptonema formosum TaxID=331992 RepID=UPI0009E5ED6B